jgi:hypothetical protein
MSKISKLLYLAVKLKKKFNVINKQKLRTIKR